MNNELLKSCQKSARSFLNTRTGFLGMGPTYGQIILSAVVGYGFQRWQEKGVVREAERTLDEVNRRNQMF